MPSATNNPFEWVSRDQLAQMLQLGPRTVDDLRKQLPAGSERKKNKRVEIKATAAFLVWAQRQERAFPLRKLASSDGTPISQAPADPGVQRLRSAKVEKAEFELAKMRGELVKVADVRRCLGTLTASARLMGERLGKRYGPDATAAVNEWVDSVAQELQAMERST